MDLYGTNISVLQIGLCVFRRPRLHHREPSISRCYALAFEMLTQGLKSKVKTRRNQLVDCFCQRMACLAAVQHETR